MRLCCFTFLVVFTSWGPEHTEMCWACIACYTPPLYPTSKWIIYTLHLNIRSLDVLELEKHVYTVLATHCKLVHSNSSSQHLPFCLVLAP